jgi:hypothetical protein
MYVRKGQLRDPKTSRQGDFRQAMMAAQRCVKVCGPLIRQYLRRLSDEPARWSAFLLKYLLGPRRANYNECLARYGNPALDRAGWETAAIEAGLRPVSLGLALGEFLFWGKFESLKALIIIETAEFDLSQRFKRLNSPPK